MKKPRVEVESIGGGACYVLRVGGETVVLTPRERQIAIELLQKADATAKTVKNGAVSRHRNRLRIAR